MQGEVARDERELRWIGIGREHGAERQGSRSAGQRPESIHSPVASDRGQPGHQRAHGRIELSGASPEREPGVLHDLFRQLSIPESPIRSAVDDVRVAVVEFGKRRRVALPQRHHQLRVRDPGRIRRHQ